MEELTKLPAFSVGRWYLIVPPLPHGPSPVAGTGESHVPLVSDRVWEMMQGMVHRIRFIITTAQRGPHPDSRILYYSTWQKGLAGVIKHTDCTQP